MKNKISFCLLLLFISITLVACGTNENTNESKEYEQITDTELLKIFTSVAVTRSYDGGNLDNDDTIFAPEMASKSKKIFNDLIDDGKLDNFSKTEAMLLMQACLEDWIKYYESGGNIQWNEDFVETEVKEYFPDLYPKIKEQIDSSKTN